MTQQLVKRTVHGGYSNVMPKSWIEGIKEKSTGRALKEILQGFNMYFLSYTGNEATTRQSVPSILRKRGLWITYVDYKNNIHTEYYNSDDIDDESFGDSSNWNIGNNSLVGDIAISANGNWVINGEETNFKAQGETGITPIFRYLTDGSETLQVSYNGGEGWEDVVKFTNNLKISRYIGADESLPTSGVAEGTIYMKGPYYDEDDTLHERPTYRMWVYAWKGNTLA